MEAAVVRFEARREQRAELEVAARQSKAAADELEAERAAVARAVEGLRMQRQKFEDARENGAAVSPTPRGRAAAQAASGGSLRAQVGLHSL